MKKRQRETVGLLLRLLAFPPGTGRLEFGLEWTVKKTLKASRCLRGDEVGGRRGGERGGGGGGGERGGEGEGEGETYIHTQWYC